MKHHALRNGYSPCTTPVEVILAAYTSKCHLCGREGNSTKGKELEIDHDHVSGKFRGWLCHRCNMGIGYFQNRTGIMMRAIKYLWLQDNPLLDYPFTLQEDR